MNSFKDMLALVNDTRTELEKIVEEELDRTGQECMQSVESDTPVRTGTLKRDWYSRGVYRDTDKYVYEFENATPYAPYVEYGHRTPSGGFVAPRFMLSKNILKYQDILNQRIYKRMRGL